MHDRSPHHGIIPVSLANTFSLVGVANGWLLPTSHQPYETSAPLGDEAPPPAPMQEAQTGAQDASAARNPTPAAAVGDTAVSADLSWDQDRGLEPASEKGGEIQRAAQVPLSRAFIDNPFCSRRPVLRELPFAGPAGMGWGVESTDTAATWATQESHQPSESTGERRESSTVFSASFPRGDEPGHSGAEEARQRFGLESQDQSGILPHKTQPSWPSVPCLKDDERVVGGISLRRRQGYGTGSLDQLDEGVDWRKPVWGERGGEEKETDARHGAGHTNTNYPHQDELVFRGSGGAATSTDQVCEVRGSQ